MTDSEFQSLEATFGYYQHLLSDFFDEAEEITDIATSILNRLRNSDNNECKLMARRIVSYQIDDIGGALLSTFKQTYDFMMTSFKGLYCSLCDGAVQKFISSTSKKITVSESFCRSLVSNSLNTLLYLRVHLPRYINLLAVFASNCSFKGRYYTRPIDQSLVQIPDTKDEKLLNQCFKYRNQPNWLSSCELICTKWKPGAIDEFFMPDFDHILSVMPILKRTNEAYQSLDGPARKRVLEEFTLKKTKRTINRSHRKFERRLQNTSQSNNKTDNLTTYPQNLSNFTANGTNVTAMELLHQLEVLAGIVRPGLSVDSNITTVFQSQNTSITTSFAKYTVEVQPTGVDFYFSGQFSDISLNAISNLIPDPDEERRLKQVKNKPSRKLKQSQIWTSVFAVLLSFLMVI